MNREINRELNIFIVLLNTDVVIENYTNYQANKNMITPAMMIVH